MLHKLRGLSTIVFGFVVAALWVAGCGGEAKRISSKPPVAKDDRAINVVQKMRTQAVSPRVGRWAVVIGISDYKYDTRRDPVKGIPDLRFADRDARAFAQFLMSPEGGAFPADHVVLLTDRRATIKEVRKAIGDFLARSLEDDLVIIFYAGHGIPDPKSPENLYLAAYDTEPGNYYGTALPMWEIDVALNRTIRSKRVFVFADACHSAGVGGSRGKSVSKEFNEYMQRLAGSKEGVTKITASRADELSQERDNLGGGHGVFTYYLLQALSGKADENRDGFVTMTEAYDYLYDRVRSDTRHSQNPWASSYVSSDIPLGIVDSEVLAAVKDRADRQSARPPSAVPVSPPAPTIDLPKDSQVAVKLARGKLAKDEPGTALDMAETIIRRNDAAKPDALALKIAVLLRDRDLKGAENTEDLLVIPYPKHPAAKKGARLVYDYYLRESQGRDPGEQIQGLRQYLKRHPDGLMTAEAQGKLKGIQAGVQKRYEKRLQESLTLARGFIGQNRFDRARQELSRAQDMVRESFSRYGISLETNIISNLRLEVETKKEAYRSRMFEEKFILARSQFDINDYTSAYRFLEEARKYGNPTQLSRAEDLALQYNTPPEIEIQLDKSIVDWDTPVTFQYRSSDKEKDTVRVVKWDFGDGKSSTDDRPQHAYGKWSSPEEERQFVVTLKTTDGYSTVTAQKSITVKKEECVARDRRFCKLANGIVRDTITGLEWKVGPDRETNLNEARSWVQNLNLDGGGWRMPTADELAGLYEKWAGPGNMTPLLETKECYVWGEYKGSSHAWGFVNEGFKAWVFHTSSKERAFAVRSRIKVVREGFREEEKTVNVEPGKSVRLKVDLRAVGKAVSEPKAFTNSLGMKFVKIPSGSFMMGSGISASEVENQYGGKEKWYEREHPQHRVTISKPFYMQTMEVTVGQWRQFIQS